MIGPFNTGQTISGVSHIALIGWAFFGGVFSAEPLDFEVTEVTTISTEDYAALFAERESPVPSAEVVRPEAPTLEDVAPEVTSEPDTPVEQAPPEPADVVEPDVVPEVVPAPDPQAEVSEEPPVLEAPSPDVAVVLPEQDVRPQPRPADRVAPEPVAQPEPDVAIDDVVQDEVTDDAEAETVQEEQDATSPEESTTEIVTEAEEPAQAAPSRSVRPQTRPQRTAAVAPEEPAETASQEPEPADTSPADDAVNAALAEALGGGEVQAPEPSGPPLTRGEKDALVVAVERCWNVGSLSTDALQTTVVVSVEMNEDSTPRIDTIRMVESTGGSGAAARQAFEAGRRAIILCGNSGFDLPVEKYNQWRKIEMVFNPEKMRIK